jgi:hypothetical protein
MVEPASPDQLIKPGAIRRGVRVFVAIAVAAAVVLIALTVNRETLHGLARCKWYWLLATGLLWLVSAAVDGARLSVLSQAGEHKLGVFRSIEIILIGYFMAAITPFQVGGLPLQLYIMNRWGISPGKASAVLLARGILFYGMLFAVAPFVALKLGVSTVLLKVLAGYIAIIVACGAVLILTGFIFPRITVNLRARLAARPQRTRFQNLLLRLLHEFDGLISGLGLFLHGRNAGYLALAALLTVIYGLTYFGMSATLLAGLGIPTNAPRVIGLDLMLTSVLLFIPTPGSGGVAEAGAAALYSMICPRYMLGIYVVLWRLWSFYIGAIVGGIAALKHASR